MALEPDTVLQNRYRVVRQLGQGGMGTVYEAKALRLNTTVALKETHFTDEKLRKQFEREAQLLAGLRHPALPRVIDHFDEGAGLYLVMDFIEGEDLWEMQQKKGSAFPVEDVLKWAEQLLDALEYLHSQEPPVIHRDIKPQNLKVTGRGQIILLDFGLAKGFAGQISRVTTSGSIFGYTPNYAPLEQIQGTGTDPRSDLYSLAATLYRLITNATPPDVLTRLNAITNGQPDPLRPAHELNALASSNTSDVLQKGMNIGSSLRYQSASEIRNALQDAVENVPASEAKTVLISQRSSDLPPTQLVKERIEQEIPPTIASPELNQKSKDLSATVDSANLNVKSPTHSPSAYKAATSLKKAAWIICGATLLIVILIISFVFWAK